MVTLAAVALTCWVCSLLALPRKPLPNDEVQELVLCPPAWATSIIYACAISSAGTSGTIATPSVPT